MDLQARQEPAAEAPAAAPSGFRFFLFASPQLALATLGLPIVIYLPAYYAGPLGLGLATSGFIFMLTRFWDVFMDGFVGWGGVRRGGGGLVASAFQISLPASLSLTFPSPLARRALIKFK